MDHYVFSGLTTQNQHIVQNLLSQDVSSLIRTAIHEVLHVHPNQLLGRSRKRQYCDARQMYFTLLRRATDLTFSEIGRTANRHHSTVISSIYAHQSKVAYDLPYQEAYAELCSEISILINRKHVKEEA